MRNFLYNGGVSTMLIPVNAKSELNDFRTRNCTQIVRATRYRADAMNDVQNDVTAGTCSAPS